MALVLFIIFMDLFILGMVGGFILLAHRDNEDRDSEGMW